MTDTSTKRVKGITKSDFEKYKTQVSAMSSGKMDFNAPKEKTTRLDFSGSNLDTKQGKRWMKAETDKVKENYSDPTQFKALLDLFTKRKETIQKRTATPGRSQVL